MSDLTELLAKVEAASGPDREIDYGLYDWFVRKWAGPAYDGYPAYTDSIDAALALVERALPNHGHLCLEQDVHGVWAASFAPGGIVYGAERGTAPLAILAALLRALIAQQAKP